MHLKFRNDSRLCRTSKGNQTPSQKNHHGNSSDDPKAMQLLHGTLQK